MIMYSLAMSIRKSFVIICIILYAADQASSMKCYSCSEVSNSPDPKDDCFVNPKKKEFEITCPTASINTFTLAFPKFNTSVALSDASAVRGRKTSYGLTDMECFKMYSTVGQDSVTVQAISRGCILKVMSDEDFEKICKDTFTKKGLTVSVDGLYRCDTNLCNSSGTLSAGLLSLICSLTLLFFTKL